MDSKTFVGKGTLGVASFFPLRNTPAQDNRRGFMRAMMLVTVSQVEEEILKA